RLVEGEGWLPERGRVLVTARPFPRFRYGDRLELRARLEVPQAAGFDYREYLARRGIVSVAAFPEIRRTESGSGSALTAAIIGFRDSLGSRLSHALPEPEAALARGILLGQRASIPRDVNEAFNAAGISHLIAISGSNVSLVAALAFAALTWPLGRRRAIIAAMALIAAFVVLVGASPSVLRAGVMAVFMLGSVLAGRPGSPITAVAFAAALLTAIEPLAALDVAFQLSFAATLGLVLLSPRMAAALSGAFGRVVPAPLALWLGESVAMTLASSLAVYPIIAANFERVSLAALPANILAVPLFGAVVVTSALTAVAGLAFESAAPIIGAFALLPLSLLLAVARGFAALPGASLEVRGFAAEAALALYAALALVAFAFWRRRPPEPAQERRLRLSPALAASLLALAVAATAWYRALAPDPGRLVVTVLDVGQGDAVLIRSPSGHTVLVDGGPSGPALLNALGAEMGSRRRIDLVVLTHPQLDHVGGLVAAVERYDVRAAAAGASFSDLPAYLAWRQALGEERAALRTLTAGETARLGAARLEVLWPASSLLSGTRDDLNNASLVLRLTYGSVSFLLTGDIASEAEEALLGATGSLQATVLKVAHHGSDTSNSPEFLAAVRPSLAVISAGDNNPYGHPSPTTLLRLAGVPVYRTDRNGAIRFETDGRRLYVRPSRGSHQLVPVSAIR
ncbi:MAG TPA: DNA internalization-related competence protein ComEC/Rec2, partial [Dehalococcoidia bacterium]|nr:DNA internalization-related competence protein ComEC/Rec2 [Dehalococcoidia bacterium]